MKTRKGKSNIKGKRTSKGRPPWDPGRPQSALVELVDRWEIRGSVLEIGCGTGNNVLYLAEHGHEAWGIDSGPSAIHRAKEKAAHRRIQVVFQVGDFLQSPNWGVYVDNILDCGLFHTLLVKDRPQFESALSRSLRQSGHFFLLCYSDRQPGTAGPRRITEKEIRQTFAKKWHVNYIYPIRMQSASHPRGAKAWLASLTHLGQPNGVLGGSQPRTAPQATPLD